MAKVIKHDIGETVLLVGTVCNINVDCEGEVMYRVTVDGLRGDHWVTEAATLDPPFSLKSESDDD